MGEIEAYGKKSIGNTLLILSNTQRDELIQRDEIDRFSAGMMLVRFLRAAPHLCSLGIDPGLPIKLLNKEGIDASALLGPWPASLTNVIREVSQRALELLQNNSCGERELFLEAIPAIQFLEQLEGEKYRLDRMSTRSSPMTLWTMWRGYHFGYKMGKANNNK